MCKYEMDPTSIVEDTEQTWFCPQTDKVKPVNPPFNLNVIKCEKLPFVSPQSSWELIHYKDAVLPG